MTTSAFTGRDITAKVDALTERLVEANRRYHAQKDPACTTWERYAIAGMDPETRERAPMWGIGCERHGIFLSGADL